MDHENRYFALMMDALDGEIAEEAQEDLEAHLRVCPDCLHEWNALVTIDALFRQAPFLSPAVGFAGRTLARLPDRRYRVWAISALYGVLLLSGVVPLLIFAWLGARYAPIVSQPALLQRIFTAVTDAARVFITVADALLTGAGRLVVQQPAIVGWLLVLAGLVFLWGGVYRQLLGYPEQVSGRR